MKQYFLSESDELYIQLQEWLKNNPFDEEEARVKTYRRNKKIN